MQGGFAANAPFLLSGRFFILPPALAPETHAKVVRTGDLASIMVALAETG